MRSSRRTTGSRTTPAYKVEITVNGDRGTLYFECHYVDAGDARRSTAGHGRRRRTSRGSTGTLADHQHGRRRSTDADRLSPCRRARAAKQRRQPPSSSERRPLSPGDNRARPSRSAACRPRSTPSCSSRSWAPRCWSSRSALLGLRVLGQSNDRVERLGALQERAPRTASSRATPRMSVCSSRRTSDPDFYRSTDPGAHPTGTRVVSLSTRRSSNALDADRACDLARQARIRASGRRRAASFARSA